MHDIGSICTTCGSYPFLLLDILMRSFSVLSRKKNSSHIDETLTSLFL
jgi:hypothetical protein